MISFSHFGDFVDFYRDFSTGRGRDIATEMKRKMAKGDIIEFASQLKDIFKNKLLLNKIRVFTLFRAKKLDGYFLHLPGPSEKSLLHIPRGFIDIDFSNPKAIYTLMHLGYLINSYDCIIGFTKADNNLYEGYDFDNPNSHPLGHLIKITEWICGVNREGFIDRNEIYSLAHNVNVDRSYTLKIEILEMF